MANLNIGTSIVDYLKSKKQDSSFTARKKLAEEQGIKDYAGTSEQNTQLYSLLNKSNVTTPSAPIQTETGQGETLGTGGTANTPVVQKSAYDQLVEKLTQNIGADTGGKTLEQMREELRTEKGIAGLKTNVSDFSTELSKANDLLADLDQRIRGGQAKESGRLAPMELITGRQEELASDASIDRNDLLNTISKLTESKKVAGEQLSSAEEDILNTLNLRQTEKTGALETMKTRAELLKTLTPEEKKLDTSIIDVGGRKVLVNNQTGESIRDLGASSSGTTTKNTFSSGGMTVPDSAIATAQNKLDTSRGSDNYANSALYLQMLKAWKNDGGLEQDFFSQFPPKNYLNPNDTSIPTYIKDKLKTTDEITNPWSQ